MPYDHSLIAAVLALVIGLVILVAPRVLNFAVALYLIVVGILGILPHVGVG